MKKTFPDFPVGGQFEHFIRIDLMSIILVKKDSTMHVVAWFSHGEDQH